MLFSVPIEWTHSFTLMQNLFSRAKFDCTLQTSTLIQTLSKIQKSQKTATEFGNSHWNFDPGHTAGENDWNSGSIACAEPSFFTKLRFSYSSLWKTNFEVENLSTLKFCVKLKY